MMRRRFNLGWVVGTFVLAAAATAGAQVVVSVSLPVIRFETPPPLVVVSPGIRVVADYDEEVFVSNGAYWVIRDGNWFRSVDYRGRWVRVNRGLPRGFATLEHGKYKHFKGHDNGDRGKGGGDNDDRGRGNGGNSNRGGGKHDKGRK